MNIYPAAQAQAEMAHHEFRYPGIGELGYNGCMSKRNNLKTVSCMQIWDASQTHGCILKAGTGRRWGILGQPFRLRR